MAGASTPPVGTVALLFGDMEGSTLLARALGAAWGEVLERHRVIVADAIAVEGGWVDGVEGDAFFATFATVDAAVRAAVAAQRAIGAEPWPRDGGGVRVRMGLHAAQVERTTTSYVGVEVHRAARVAAAAHGGQLLLTAAARHLLTDQVPVDDLGLHRLKDFPEAERLFCAVIDGRGGADFPRPRTEAPRLASLPAVLDSFVGRERELAEVADLVTAHRLVTLLGPGGSGKTRLAVEVAGALTSRSTDGPYFVDLAPATDASLVPERVASALQVRPGPGQSPGDALAEALSSREMLVVLDNLEQVAEAGAAVTELLTQAPGLRLLVTSREPLHARGEQRYTVEPLEAPGPDDDLASPNARAASATVLFVDRARAVDREFALTTRNAAVVASICRRLDGLPLAIELAVGWLRVLSPEILLQQLGGSLHLLRESGGARPDRQQTLRATIDWSYRLLDGESARAFRALSVFVGGWTLEAAGAVCGCADPATALGLLGALTECSLVEATRTLGADPRFRMLETLREYGHAELAMSGEESAVRARHADFVVGLAARSEAALTGPDEVGCLAQLDLERDNIKAALRWLAETGQQTRALDAAAKLWRHWRVRAYLEEGRALLKDLVADLPADAPDDVRAGGLIALGSLAYWHLDYASAEDTYREALRVYTRSVDEAGIAEANLDLGYVRQVQGDGQAAARAFGTALRGFRAVGDELGAANALIGLGFAAFVARDLDAASACVTDGLTVLRRLGPTYDANNALSMLGAIQRLQGHFADADASDRAALIVHTELGNTPGVVWMLSELAAVAVETGRPDRALRLAAAAQALQAGQHHGVALQLLSLPDVRLRAAEALGPKAADHLWTAGHRLSQAEAIDLAMSSPLLASLGEDPGG